MDLIRIINFIHFAISFACYDKQNYVIVMFIIITSPKP